MACLCSILVGELSTPLADFASSLLYFPVEGSKLRAKQVQIRHGGNVSNSLEVLAQLIGPWRGEKVSLHLISSLPERDSPATKSIRASFPSSEPSPSSSPSVHVDLHTCLYRLGRPQAASSYIIQSRESDSRNIVNYNDLPEMSVEKFVAIVDRASQSGDIGDSTNANGGDIDGDGSSSWWHFEGRIPETTLKCMRHLKTSLPGAGVSVDVENPRWEGLKKLAAEADIVFYSRTYAESTGTPATCLNLFFQPKLGRRHVKPDGADAGDGGCFHCPVQVANAGDRTRKINVVDTIGAGDAFIAGVLYGLLCHGGDWDARRIARFAVELGSLKVEPEGFGGLGVAMRQDNPGYLGESLGANLDSATNSSQYGGIST